MPTINGKACVANGRNLIIQSDLKGGYLSIYNGGNYGDGSNDFRSDNYIATNGATVFTFSSPDYTFKGSGSNTLAMYDSDKNYLGYQLITSATQTLSKSNVAYIMFSINFTNEGGTKGQLSDWLANHRYKLEKGSVATPLTPAPVDKVFSNGKQVYGRNLALGTSKQVVQANNWNMQVADIKYDKSLGDNLCASVMFNNADYASVLLRGAANIILNTYDSSGNILANIYGNEIRYNANGLSQLSISINDGTADIKAYIFTNNMNQNAFYSCLKLEIGTISTPWTPAPEDVM